MISGYFIRFPWYLVSSGDRGHKAVRSRKILSSSEEDSD